jgi:hypothetical protein
MRLDLLKDEVVEGKEQSNAAEGAAAAEQWRAWINISSSL